MDILTQWGEFKEAWQSAQADGKLSMNEIATIAVEGGEFVAEVGKLLLSFLPKDDAEPA